MTVILQNIQTRLNEWAQNVFDKLKTSVSLAPDISGGRGIVYALRSG